KEKVLRARHFVKRAVEVLKVLVEQIHILETMQPVEFLAFRNRLMPASGFQSAQFREVEFMLGIRDNGYLRFFQHEPTALAALERRLGEPSLRDTYYDMLRGLGFDLPQDTSVQTLEANEQERQRLFDSLRTIYADPESHLELYLLTESLVDIDEFIGLWRYHHVRVVERVIGFKRGTGGSSGVGYLDSTTKKRAFPYLWELRTHLEA
ncbi:MAG: tryptophan 2,3-dioxygenase, partial [Myxococcales bacterium]|nr:tryptophan 2,3-dioxygenase [Myxococcales bacterium]